ncbi:MAG: hypothetical protein H0U70_09790 [Tatlockia sp.]|nr:hypothetical protein [Tatlockia sp.]
MRVKFSRFFILFTFITISFSSFAEKILLTGRPVILIPELNYYRFPNTYSPFTNYHFVNISGDNRVCFIKDQPQLDSLDLLRIFIIRDNKKFLWYCYRYNSNFFTIDY